MITHYFDKEHERDMSSVPHSGAAATLTAPSLEAFRQMAVIRRFEERALELSLEGVIAGSMHLCLGQEAIPVGALCGARRDGIAS